MHEDYHRATRATQGQRYTPSPARQETDGYKLQLQVRGRVYRENDEVHTLFRGHSPSIHGSLSAVQPPRLEGDDGSRYRGRQFAQLEPLAYLAGSRGQAATDGTSRADHRTRDVDEDPSAGNKRPEVPRRHAGEGRSPRSEEHTSELQ